MKRYGIRLYIACITLVPLIVITVCLESFFLHNYFSELDLHSVERGKLIANQFAASSEYGVVSNNLSYLEKITRNVFKEPDVSGVVILNSESVILTESGYPAHSIEKLLAELRYATTGNSPGVSRHGNESLRIFQPILPETVALNEFEAVTAIKPIGTVIVELSLARTEKLKSEILWYTIATTMGFLALISFIVFLASRSITYPITMLSNVIKKIALGNLATRVDSASHMSELEVLSQGINHMAEQLHEERAVLQHKVEVATLDLRNSKEKAERANKAKSQFLAAASHDLRQPLHALGLFASALSERIKFPEVRQLVENINKSVAALEELFNSLLDISRLDAGVIQPKFQHFRIKELMGRLSTEFNTPAHLKGLDIRFEGEDIVAYSDPVLLETVLRNLISNAIRYTQNGEVNVTWLIEGKRVCIQVRDTGVGISDEDREHIFEEFLQLNNPDRDRTKGFGLGLAIVKRLSRLLKSTISVQSTVGSGSVFQLHIPLGDETQISDKSSSLVHHLQSEPAMLVLVIDDEHSVRDAMTALLKTWGHEVIAVSSLEEALETIKRSPDAIIADYRLKHGKTGIEAIQNIHQKWGAAIPALIVTGDTSSELLREVQTSGYACMHKPVNSAKLRAFLRSASRHRSVPS
jgi:signal transduction histidine kinase/CheY-like chemotaxis protein